MTRQQQTDFRSVMFAEIKRRAMEGESLSTDDLEELGQDLLYHRILHHTPTNDEVVESRKVCDSIMKSLRRHISAFSL